MITSNRAKTQKALYLHSIAASSLGLFALASSALGQSPKQMNPSTKQAEVLTQRAKASNLIVESEEALNLCNEALRKDHNYAPAFIARAEANKSLGKIDDALGDLTKASQSANNEYRTKALRERASLYIGLKRYQDALADLNIAIKNQSSDGLYCLRAKCYGALHKPDLAAQDLTVALQNKRNPDCRVLEDRANYYLASHQLNKALAEYSALIKTDESQGDGLANDSLYKSRARVYQLLGQAKLANLDLKKASEKQKTTFENSPFRSKNRQY